MLLFREGQTINHGICAVNNIDTLATYRSRRRPGTYAEYEPLQLKAGQKLTLTGIPIDPDDPESVARRKPVISEVGSQKSEVGKSIITIWIGLLARILSPFF